MQTVGFLLIDGFALFSYSSAVEPLRAANVLSEHELYRWRHISIDGTPATASNGVRVAPDCRVGDHAGFDAVIVCAGGNPTLFDDSATLNWLRRLAREGVRLGGVSGGPWILARAGLLAKYRCTIHWEHLPALSEAFPQLDVRRTVFEIDRDRLTCAGGVAALDMMIEVVSRAHGAQLGVAVAEWFLRTEPRSGSASQRMSPRERFGVANEPLLRALSLMDARMEQPVDSDELAAHAGVSLRQLERLFRKYLNVSPAEQYLSLRLDRSRNLLRQTTLSVTEIAIVTGFSSSSHFSRSYRARFGQAPREERRVGPGRRPPS